MSSSSFAALQAEIARKKAEKEAAKAAVVAAGVQPIANKYVKRGDIERVLESKSAPSATAAATSAKLATSTVVGQSTNAPASASSTAGTSNSATSAVSSYAAAAAAPAPASVLLPRSEVVRRLRRHGLVVTYFGETDDARVKRLRAYEDEHVAEREVRRRLPLISAVD